MKYLKEWDIVYDGNCDTFRPGDTVRGKVAVDVEKTVTVSRIKVKFKGKAEVTMFIGDYDTQRVNYFNHEKILFKCPENTDSFDLPPGHYEYPFHFHLPLGLPYTFSCEGNESGIVAYDVQATIYRPGKYTFVYDKPFNVLGVLDLNCLDDITAETQTSMVKTLKCLAWNCGDISVNFTLPKKGFVPGEEVHLNVTIKNNSKRRVIRSVVLLMQRITMMVYGSKSVRSRKICDCQHGPIPPGGIDEWIEETLIIPEGLPPTSMETCELIEIQYRIQLVVTPSGLSRKFRVPLDIVLGTVPLRSVKSNPPQKELRKDTFPEEGTCV